MSLPNKLDDRHDSHPLLNALHEDHANTAMLLNLLDIETTALGENTRPDYDTLAVIMDYFVTFPDLFHHGNEDVLFERLMEQVPSSRRALVQLVEQHQFLALLGRELRDAIDQILSDIVIARDGVVKNLTTYTQSLRTHASRRVRYFPVALRTPGRTDWEHMDTVFIQRDDPLFGDIVATRYGALAERLARRFHS
jgi:hemerythrin-like domain-containing protein